MLVSITNKKSHIRFRLVPKVVTLNYLERRNGLICVISPNSVAFKAHYVEVVDGPIVHHSIAYIRLQLMIIQCISPTCFSWNLSEPNCIKSAILASAKPCVVAVLLGSVCAAILLS